MLTINTRLPKSVKVTFKIYCCQSLLSMFSDKFYKWLLHQRFCKGLKAGNWWVCGNISISISRCVFLLNDPDITAHHKILLQNCTILIHITELSNLIYRTIELLVWEHLHIHIFFTERALLCTYLHRVLKKGNHWINLKKIDKTQSLSWNFKKNGWRHWEDLTQAKIQI